jgi:hypothetical protein
MDFLSPSSVVLAISIITFLIVVRFSYLTWKVYKQLAKDKQQDDKGGGKN